LPSLRSRVELPKTPFVIRTSRECKLQRFDSKRQNLAVTTQSHRWLLWRDQIPNHEPAKSQTYAKRRIPTQNPIHWFEHSGKRELRILKVTKVDIRGLVTINGIKLRDKWKYGSLEWHDHSSSSQRLPWFFLATKNDNTIELLLMNNDDW